MKVFGREETGRFPQVAADDLAASAESVLADVVEGMARKLGLKLDADDPYRGVAFREKDCDYADTRAEVENALAAPRAAEAGEQEGVKAVTVAAIRLGEDGLFSPGHSEGPGAEAA